MKTKKLKLLVVLTALSFLVMASAVSSDCPFGEGYDYICNQPDARKVECDTEFDENGTCDLSTPKKENKILGKIEHILFGDILRLIAPPF